MNVRTPLEALPHCLPPVPPFHYPVHKTLKMESPVCFSSRGVQGFGTEALLSCFTGQSLSPWSFRFPSLVLDTSCVNRDSLFRLENMLWISPHPSSWCQHDNLHKKCHTSVWAILSHCLHQSSSLSSSSTHASVIRVLPFIISWLDNYNWFFKLPSLKISSPFFKLLLHGVQKSFSIPYLIPRPPRSSWFPLDKNIFYSKNKLVSITKGVILIVLSQDL